MTRLYPELAVIIPAHNEKETITEIVSRTIALGCRVLVVDDASNDGTARAAYEAGAEVLVQKQQRGNLRSIQAGMNWLLEHRKFPHQWLATVDADGQHSPEDLRILLEQARTQPRTVVIGSCPERSSWMRQIVWSFFRRLTGLKLRDLTSGFKIYPRNAAFCLSGPQGRCLIYQDLPTLLFLCNQGFNLVEIPVPMAPRRVGISRVFSSWSKIAVYMFRVTGTCLIYRLKRLIQASKRY